MQICGNSVQRGQTISKTTALVLQQSKEVNQRLGHGMPKLTDAHVVQSNRRSTVAQTAEKVGAGSDRKMSEYRVGMGPHSYRPFKDPILTPPTMGT